MNGMPPGSGAAPGPSTASESGTTTADEDTIDVSSLPVTRRQNPTSNQLKTADRVAHRDRLIRQAQEKDVAVAVRIDIEQDGVHLNDTFNWNGGSDVSEMTDFAETTVRDLKLDQSFLPAIINAIKDQVQSYQNTGTMAQALEDTSLLEEARIPVRLNVNVGNVFLIDQIEWAISSPLSDADLFASHLCSELGLGGTFATIISHNIREQVEFHRRTLLAQGSIKRSSRIVPEGFEILPPVTVAFRGKQEQEEYCPFVQTYNDEKQLQALRQKEMRNVRRMRRGIPDLLVDTTENQSSGRRGRRQTRVAPDHREPLGSPDVNVMTRTKRKTRGRMGM